jgi:CHASE1-domain containing sensor protein
MIPYATSIKYMLAGYGVILSVLIIYLVSLFVRFRNLKRDIQMLEEIRKKPA